MTPEQIPLFETPAPPSDHRKSMRWVKDAIKKGDTRRDGGKGDKYDADKFIESTNRETT